MSVSDKVKVVSEKCNKPDWMTDTASSAVTHFGCRSTAGWNLRSCRVGMNRHPKPVTANCRNSPAVRRAIADEPMPSNANSFSAQKRTCEYHNLGQSPQHYKQYITLK